jgi:hypothetical protein
MQKRTAAFINQNQKPQVKERAQSIKQGGRPGQTKENHGILLAFASQWSMSACGKQSNMRFMFTAIAEKQPEIAKLLPCHKMSEEASNEKQTNKQS